MLTVARCNLPLRAAKHIILPTQLLSWTFSISQVKLLNKELQALREAGAQATESLQKAKAEHIQLQRKLQDHALELQSLEAVKDARYVGSPLQALWPSGLDPGDSAFLAYSSSTLWSLR